MSAPLSAAPSSTSAARRATPAGRLVRLPRPPLTLPIRAYQVGISPYTPPACRYYPVCSQYALDALGTHGAVKGGSLALGRICRRNPVSRGGVDPVPAPGMWRNPRAGTPSGSPPDARDRAVRHAQGGPDRPNL